MLNELLWIVLMLFSFSGILLAYRFFGKTGLYVWMTIAIILANIQVMKTISFFGLVTALGNVIYGSMFLVTDIINENHSKKDAKKAVYIGFFVLISVTIIMQVCLQFIPHSSDELSPALNTVFGLLPRIAFASLTAFIVSQLFDIWIFDKMKKKSKGKKLWLRNNISTMSSQLIDNIIFTYIAFVGFGKLLPMVFPWQIVIQIFIVSYIMKFVVSICDTPFIYLSKIFKKKYKLS
jgi:queuosine precursor transporter